MRYIVEQLHSIIDQLQKTRHDHLMSRMDWQVELPARLRELRKGAGLTYTQLAAETGISRSYLHEIEQGGSEPTVGVLSKILQIYGLRLAIVPIDEEEQ